MPSTNSALGGKETKQRKEKERGEPFMLSVWEHSEPRMNQHPDQLLNLNKGHPLRVRFNADSFPCDTAVVARVAEHQGRRWQALLSSVKVVTTGEAIPAADGRPETTMLLSESGEERWAPGIGVCGVPTKRTHAPPSF